jgi:tRNA A37 N6-isopentenylltransferase MiaA
MRFAGIVAIVALFLSGCGNPPAPPTPPDATKEAWYGQTVAQLSTLTREADELFRSGKPDAAAALIQKGEPLSSQILAVLHPTLPAMEAAGDLDDLYGRMLVSNRHYTWAQTFFQKNRARWKYWQPQTPDTARRMQLAEAEIAECEKHLGQ